MERRKEENNYGKKKKKYFNTVDFFFPFLTPSFMKTSTVWKFFYKGNEDQGSGGEKLSTDYPKISRF